MLKIADTQTVGTASYCLPMGPIGKETPQWDEVKFVLQRKKKKTKHTSWERAKHLSEQLLFCAKSVVYPRK